MLVYGMNIPLDRPRSIIRLLMCQQPSESSVIQCSWSTFTSCVWNTFQLEMFVVMNYFFSKILCTGSSVSDFIIIFDCFVFILVMFLWSISKSLDVFILFSLEFFPFLWIKVSLDLSFNLLLCWILFVCSLPHLTTVIVKLILPFLLLSRSRNRILNLH